MSSLKNVTYILLLTCEYIYDLLVGMWWCIDHVEEDESLHSLGLKMIAYSHFVLLFITSHGVRQLHVSVTHLF